MLCAPMNIMYHTLLVVTSSHRPYLPLSSAMHEVDSGVYLHFGNCIFCPNSFHAVGNSRALGPSLGYNNHRLLFSGLELCMIN